MLMRRCRGQSLTEFIIVMPLFFALLFGVFEFTYMYRAKATLNTATFEAARAGSLHHAKLDEMRKALTTGMMALYVQGDRSLSGLGKGYAKVYASELAMNAQKATITVISPTKEIFRHFKVKRMITLQGDSKEKHIEIIPNDNLNVRSTKLKKITVDGGNQKISIQDANLLKIKSYWCYEMKVPIIKNLIYEIVSGGFLGVSASPEQSACNVMSTALNSKYIALTSHTIVRMQSSVINTGSNLK